jgi:ubiquitin carboxyl-terminal hydrolase 8
MVGYHTRSHSVTGQTIEDSLTVAPRDEWVLFCNRDKFDLIAIYDDASESPGPPDAPLARLVRAIYETAFRKILKRVPVLLIGGIEAWKHEFGERELVKAEPPVVPAPIPVSSAAPQAAEVYVPPSPRPPTSPPPQASRISSPGVGTTSPTQDVVRTLPPAPRSPLPNRTRVGTDSVSDTRPPPLPDNHPHRSVDQGPASPRYDISTDSLCLGALTVFPLLSVPEPRESRDLPQEPVRRIQRKPTMARPPSISSLNAYPRTMSEGVRFSSRFFVLMLTSHAGRLPHVTTCNG